jgi:nitroimidazol reductase NimA-like FMN-containing flavoprotein (pyridoxamine 5'-phosphate oxidase superfamily)
MPMKNQDGPTPVAIDISNHTGVLDVPTCVELIESTPIGRIGFWVDDAPLVLPVNFAWFEDSVVFRTLDGQKLAAAAETQAVCFEVDHWDSSDRSGWSVVIIGRAREVTDWAECEQLENLGLVSWAYDTWRPIWVRIDPTAITGRTLR